MAKEEWLVFKGKTKNGGDRMRQAWVTRRAKYGAAGHDGAYATDHIPDGPLGTARVAIARLHNAGFIGTVAGAEACGLSASRFMTLADKVKRDTDN